MIKLVSISEFEFKFYDNNVSLIVWESHNNIKWVHAVGVEISFESYTWVN